MLKAIFSGNISTTDELVHAIKMKIKPSPLKSIEKEKNYEKEIGYCYKKLNQTSRSFSAVILELPKSLRDSICIFYLVLRALDSIEDDTSIPYIIKIPLLRNFHDYLSQKNFNIYKIVKIIQEKEIIENEYIEGKKVEEKEKEKEKEKQIILGENENEIDLLNNLSILFKCYQKLDKNIQKVIKYVTENMGKGMAEYLKTKINTTQDYDKYCYYVAGLVGYGLTEIFIESNFEKKEIKKGDDPNKITENLWYSMSLFLQKTNIIRDYKEDIDQNRVFWPKEIWSIYSKKIEDFGNKQNHLTIGVKCINHLVTNALVHVPKCIEYLSRLENQKVFNFCAIPQVMAISTLAEVYNNEQVCKRNVKIRKGVAVKLMQETKNIDDVKRVFYHFICKIEKKFKSKNTKDDKVDLKTKKLIDEIKKITKGYGEFKSGMKLSKIGLGIGIFTCVGVGIGIGYSYYYQKQINKIKNINKIKTIE